jgi:hypothetical protein
MNGHLIEPSPALMSVPSEAEAARCVLAARALFARTLAKWACDALAIRRRGAWRATWPTHGGTSMLSRAA